MTDDKKPAKREPAITIRITQQIRELLDEEVERRGEESPGIHFSRDSVARAILLERLVPRKKKPR